MSASFSYQTNRTRDVKNGRTNKTIICRIKTRKRKVRLEKGMQTFV